MILLRNARINGFTSVPVSAIADATGRANLAPQKRIANGARAGRERSQCRARAAHSARSPNSVESPSAPPPPPLELGGGAAAAVTDNVAEVAGEVPATFEQTSVYVSDPTADGLTVSVPLLAIAPDQLPEAVQPSEVFTDDQVSVVELPVTMDADARVSVGAGGTIAGTICAAMSA